MQEEKNQGLEKATENANEKRTYTKNGKQLSSFVWKPRFAKKPCFR